MTELNLWNFPISRKKYSVEYRLVYQPLDKEQIAIVVPTGEVSLSGVRSRIINHVGQVEFVDIDLPTFIQVSPKDRLLRNAWKFNSTGVIEDVGLSRKLIKTKRNAALSYIDQLALKEGRKPNGNIKFIDSVAKSLRDIPQQEGFLSEDIHILRGFSSYIDGIYGAMQIDSEIDLAYFDNSLFSNTNNSSLSAIKKTLAAVMKKSFIPILKLAS